MLGHQYQEQRFQEGFYNRLLKLCPQDAYGVADMVALCQRFKRWFMGKRKNEENGDLKVQACVNPEIWSILLDLCSEF